jgi:hypothetical protein
MARAVEREVKAVVAHSLTPEPIADADLVHQVDGPLLQHARADALDHVVLAAVLEDDGVDAAQVQQVSEHEPRRAGADDGNLSRFVHGVRPQ